MSKITISKKANRKVSITDLEGKEKGSSFSLNTSLSPKDIANNLKKKIEDEDK